MLNNLMRWVLFLHQLHQYFRKRLPLLLLRLVPNRCLGFLSLNDFWLGYYCWWLIRSLGRCIRYKTRLDLIMLNYFDLSFDTQHWRLDLHRLMMFLADDPISDIIQKFLRELSSLSNFWVFLNAINYITDHFNLVTVWHLFASWLSHAYFLLSFYRNHYWGILYFVVLNL